MLIQTGRPSALPYERYGMMAERKKQKDAKACKKKKVDAALFWGYGAGRHADCADHDVFAGAPDFNLHRKSRRIQTDGKRSNRDRIARMLC